jgi:hypothetical protein
MSDYESSTLLAKLPEIRDQLGILEASLVPDTDNSYIPDTTHDVDDVEEELEELVQSTSSLSVSKHKKGGKRRKSPLSGTASTSDSGLRTETTSTGTSPVSETEGEDANGEGYLDQLELLGELFSTV